MNRWIALCELRKGWGMSDESLGKFRKAAAKAIAGNLGLRMALILANPKAYEANLADLSDLLANDAIMAVERARKSRAKPQKT
jgi:hypothetical protein